MISGYEDNKVKVFTTIIGQCTKELKRQLEGQPNFDEMDEKSDVVSLITSIKRITYDAHDLKYQASGNGMEHAG